MDESARGAGAGEALVRRPSTGPTRWGPRRSTSPPGRAARRPTASTCGSGSRPADQRVPVPATDGGVGLGERSERPRVPGYCRRAMARGAGRGAGRSRAGRVRRTGGGAGDGRRHRGLQLAARVGPGAQPGTPRGGGRRPDRLAPPGSRLRQHPPGGADAHPGGDGVAPRPGVAGGHRRRPHHRGHRGRRHRLRRGRPRGGRGGGRRHRGGALAERVHRLHRRSRGGRRRLRQGVRLHQGRRAGARPLDRGGGVAADADQHPDRRTRHPAHGGRRQGPGLHGARVGRQYAVPRRRRRGHLRPETRRTAPPTGPSTPSTLPTSGGTPR